MKKFLLLAAISLAAFAADVTGKYSAETPGRGGQGTVKQTFDLKQDGDKLTGSVTGMGGRENAISDGKVDGDKITFTVKMETPRGEFKSNYEGKVAGSEIQFKVKREGSENPPREFTAKKE